MGDEGLGGLRLAEWADLMNERTEKGHPGNSVLRVNLNSSSDRDATIGRSIGADIAVISFSHFISDKRLMPEKRFLMYPNLVGFFSS